MELTPLRTAVRKIYLLVGEEQKGPYSEEEVQEMTVAGTVTPETLHWTEEMTEWQVWGQRETASIRKTIAPPRRSQNGESNGKYVVERQSLVPEKNIDLFSTRSKSVTLIKGVTFIALFFAAVTLTFKFLAHSVPDPGKQFSAMVEKATLSK
jgi:hypothetical protein